MTRKFSDYRIEIRPVDGGYMASIPQLPGCMADGMTPWRAMYEIAAAFDAWTDAARAQGREVPEPELRGSVSNSVATTLDAVISALDRALGDTDITHVESDEEMRDDYPVQWACSQLSALLQSLELPEPDDSAWVPDGWKLVPIEPTPEMLAAVKPRPAHWDEVMVRQPELRDWMESAVITDRMVARSDYLTMLATAPAPPKGTK